MKNQEFIKNNTMKIYKKQNHEILQLIFEDIPEGTEILISFSLKKYKKNIQRFDRRILDRIMGHPQ